MEVSYISCFVISRAKCTLQSNWKLVVNKFKFSDCSASKCGVLITGGNGALRSTEIFLPSRNTSCSLRPLLPQGRVGHTQDNGLACGGYRSSINTLKSCDRWKDGKWGRVTISLREKRRNHVSWSTRRGLYLIGGEYSKRTTELVGLDSNVKDGFILNYDAE